MANESNASGDTNENRVRIRHEYRHVLDQYLNVTRTKDFKLIFPDTISSGKLDKYAIHFLIAKLAIESDIDYKVLWGLDVVYSILQEEKPARMLEKNFDFKHRDYIKLIGKLDVFRIIPLSSSISFHPPIQKTSLAKVFVLLTQTYLKELYKTIVRFLTSR
jgi:hypothetical protein